MKAGKGGKHMVMCEVCHDAVKHHDSIVVGRKLSGVARCIHNRAKCRQRWERNKERLMERWPELREPAAVSPPPASTKPAPALAVRIQGLSTRDIERAREASTVINAANAALLAERDACNAANAAGKEAVSNLSVVPQKPPVHRPHSRYVFKPALDERIVEYLKAHPYKRGVAMRLWAILESEKSDLMVDLRGHAITYGSFQLRVVTLWAAMSLPAAPAPAPAPAPEKSEGLALGRDICSQVWNLVAEGDVNTLRAIRDILNETP